MNNLHSTDKLKKLIMENPDLPIIVMVSDEASSYDYKWTVCDNVTYEITEVLDCTVPWSDYYYTDESIFEDELFDHLYEDYDDIDDPELEQKFQAELKKYEPFWKKAIAIWVDQ